MIFAVLLLAIVAVMQAVTGLALYWRLRRIERWVWGERVPAPAANVVDNPMFEAAGVPQPWQPHWQDTPASKVDSWGLRDGRDGNEPGYFDGADTSVRYDDGSPLMGPVAFSHGDGRECRFDRGEWVFIDHEAYDPENPVASLETHCERDHSAHVHQYGPPYRKVYDYSVEGVVNERRDCLAQMCSHWQFRDYPDTQSGAIEVPWIDAAPPRQP